MKSSGLKVYCAGAMRGNTEYQRYFLEIIKIVEATENIVLSELSSSYTRQNLSDNEIYKRDMDWLNEAECMIAEVSGPSIGVGYEIAYALHCRNIPVLALCNKNLKRLSAMISGNNSKNFYLEFYSDELELKKKVITFLDSCKNLVKMK